MKRADPAEVLAALAVTPDPFAVDLVGAWPPGPEIDALVAEAAEGWELDRMPVLDRAVLRLATYELVAEPGTPVAVVIDEAVELAKQYSTEFGRIRERRAVDHRRRVRP